jgi:hypothetical protein
VATARRLLRTDPSSKDAHSKRAKLTGTDPLSRLKRALLDAPHTRAASVDIGRSLEQAAYIDFSKQRYEHELVFDIDADKNNPASPAAAMELARRIAAELLGPAKCCPFLEPSRSRWGAYVRFIVVRETEDAVEFNRMLTRLQRHLRARYGRATGKELAWLDKVAGELVDWGPNPDFDTFAYNDKPSWASHERMTDGENYDWRKRHAETPGQDGSIVYWTYHSELERYAPIHGGDQITLPLHRLPADPDGGARRLGEFAAYLESPCSRVPESFLRALLPLVDVVKAAEDGQAQKVDRVRPLLSAKPSIVVPDVGLPLTPAAFTSKFGNGRDTRTFLDSGADQFARYQAASRLTLRQLGDRDPAAVHSLALRMVELPFGPATGLRDPGREDEVDRCIEFCLRTYDPAAAAVGRASQEETGPRFDGDDLAELENVVKGRIPYPMLAAAQTKHPRATKLTYRLLAAALAVMLRGIHTGRQPTDVPRDYLKKSLVDRRFRGCNDTTIAALFELLMAPEAGLIAMVGKEGRRQCRRYVLDPFCFVPSWLSRAVSPVLVLHKTWFPEEAASPSGPCVLPGVAAAGPPTMFMFQPWTRMSAFAPPPSLSLSDNIYDARLATAGAGPTPALSFTSVLVLADQGEADAGGAWRRHARISATRRPRWLSNTASTFSTRGWTTTGLSWRG